MRVAKRRGEALVRSKSNDTDLYLTSRKIQNLERELSDLIAVRRPDAIEELRRTQEMGDLSENAAYQEAKYNLRRINSRILSIQDKLKNAIVIEKTNDGTVRIGSVVEFTIDGAEMEFEIVGEQEADPMRGRISFKSPIGSALMGHAAGESFDTVLGLETSTLKIIEIH